MALASLSPCVGVVPRGEGFGTDEGDLLYDALDAVQRDAVINTLAMQHARRPLDDRTKPFVQRFDDGDREPLTWFHSRVVPGASLGAIFATVAKRIRTFDAATGRAAVVLMRRYSDHTGLAITTHMVHRLFLAGLIVAAKAHHDAVCRNCDFARVAGLHGREIYRLELALCVGVDWRTLVTGSDMNNHATRHDASSSADFRLHGNSDDDDGHASTSGAAHKPALVSAHDDGGGNNDNITFLASGEDASCPSSNRQRDG